MMRKFLTLVFKSLVFILISIVYILPSPARAQEFNCESGYEQIYDGVSFKKESVDTPRTLAIFSLKIDLNNPNIDVFITPKDGLGTTTSQFLDNYDLQLAINGDESIDLFPKGMAASQGDIYAPKTNEPVIFFSPEKKVTMGHDIPSTVWNAIAGSHTIVEDGKVGSKISTCSKPEYCEHLQPRTAVGVTEDNQLLIFIIDGRQPGYSEGITLIELANFMLSCQAESAINLDGGGSTTLVTENGGVINNYSDSQERTVANHLGIFAKPGTGTPPTEPTQSPEPPGSPGGPSGQLFCDKSYQTSVDEPHPLRPNPFNVCPRQPQGTACSDDIIVTKTVNIPKGEGSCRPAIALPGATVRCKTDVSFSLPISINLSELDLPVAGLADRDCETGACLADTFGMGEEMANYTSWYQQGINAEQANTTESYQQRKLETSGPLYKLIPQSVINSTKESLVKQAKSKKIYDQIVCYLQDDVVIDRLTAKEKMAAGETVDFKRLSDFKNHLNPLADDQPWYTCWQQMPLSVTKDEYGEVEFKASVSDPDIEVEGINPVTVPAAFPHVAENVDLTNDLLLPIFHPQIENEMENFGGTCNPNKAVSVGQYVGDRIGTNQTITRTITVVKKNVEYSFKMPNKWGVPPGGTVEVSVSVPISVTTKPPKGLDTIWKNLVGGKSGVFRAFAPANMKLEDLPVERDLSISCGADCTVDPRHSQAVLAHLGGIKLYFQDALQAMLNPFKKLAFTSTTPIGGASINPFCPVAAQDMDINYIFEPLYEPIPPDDPSPARQFVKNNYPSNTHLNGNIPADEAIGCLITYSQKFWSGSDFKNNYLDVINFALTNDWNPAYLLALWLEESHAGQTSGPPLGCGMTTTLAGNLDCLANDYKINSQQLTDDEGRIHTGYKSFDTDDFMCYYGGYPLDSCDFSLHPNFVKNLFIFYNYLINR